MYLSFLLPQTARTHDLVMVIVDMLSKIALPFPCSETVHLSYVD